MQLYRVLAGLAIRHCLPPRPGNTSSICSRAESILSPPANPGRRHAVHSSAILWSDWVGPGDRPKGSEPVVRFPFQFPQDEGDGVLAHRDDRLISGVLD